MPADFDDQNYQDSTPSLDVLEEEILSGLTGDRDRLDCARANEDFYALRNEMYIERRESEDWADYDRRPKRTSKLTRKAIQTLTSKLYSPGPARKADDPTADAFLQDVYASCHVNALMQRADRKATLNDACALQAVATGQPDRPVRLYLWGAGEFVPFFTDDDPTTPWAVCTISILNKGGKKWRRYQLWSALEHRVYETRPIDSTLRFDTAGGTRANFKVDLSGMATPEGKRDARNPYGVLPFSFCWNELPVDSFWGSGIGSALRAANAEIDRELSDIAEHAQKFLNPRLFTRNVALTFRWKDRPGTPANLPASGGARDSDGKAQPEIFALELTPNIEAAWMNVEKYANQTFHELDVPLSAVRQDQSGPTSGIQIIAEQAPLIAYTKARQSAWTVYETERDRMVLRVAGTYYDAPALTAAADDLALALTWPEPATDVPSMDESEIDAANLQARLTTRVRVLMRKGGLTRDQAIEQLEEMAEEHAIETRLLGPLPEDLGMTPPGAPAEGEATAGDDEATVDAPDDAAGAPTGEDGPVNGTAGDEDEA